MFETRVTSTDETSVAVLAAARELLSACVPGSTTASMFEQMRALHEIGSVLAAAEATVTASFVIGRRAEQKAAGLPARRVGQGLPQEVGLARRVSPNRAGVYAGFATVLTRELPCTLAALRAGTTSEWRAMLIARETGWLSVEHRTAVDAHLGPRLGSLSDQAVEAEAARLAYALDPRGKSRAIERAVGDRHVSVRPAADGMCRFNAVLPLAQGVAAYAALCREADTARAAGDERGRGQVMADTLVERVTGQATADGVPLTVDLIMTDQALFGGGRSGEPSDNGPEDQPRDDRPGADAETGQTRPSYDETGDDRPSPAGQPATVSGYGPVPALWAREMIVRTASDPDAGVRIRRLFTDPAGNLVTMETTARAFTPAMAEFVRLRDQWCATPWCGAPIRHIDHIMPVAQGGPTSLKNAQGLCEACNYAKEAPGWTTIAQPDGSVTTTTPTGHDAETLTRPRAPDLPAGGPHRRPRARPGRINRMSEQAKAARSRPPRSPELA